jgi:Uma2 family endonuclease
MTTISEKPPMITLADWVPGPKQGEWTYSDYAALPDDGRRYEVMNGVLLLMPSPSRSHQKTVGELFIHLRTHVQTSSLGEVYMAPFDVELAPDTIVQPDVLVILNAGLEKVAEEGVIGAPDLVVEVASPSTGPYDRLTKYYAYARARVPEYWIVNPEKRTVEVLALEGNTYHSLGIFRGQDILPSQIIPGLPVHVEQFFASI